MFKSPILFLIFNRPDTTQKVFNTIRQVKPAFLYVAADGPRNQKEQEDCCKTREIIKQIDWPCKLKTLFRENNLGCKDSIIGAIDWFFLNVEEGIIIEDDCLPNITFFDFCETLLENHRNDENILHIGGNNFQFGKSRTQSSYYFSYIAHIWGWATWRRAWIKFNETQLRLSVSKNIKKEFNIKNNEHLDYLITAYNNTKETSWGYTWMLTVWLFNGLAIIPNKNLVTNIGFGENSTHTNNSNDILANIPSEPISEIIFNDRLTRHRIADNYTFNKVLLRQNRFQKAKKVLKKLLKLK